MLFFFSLSQIFIAFFLVSFLFAELDDETDDLDAVDPDHSPGTIDVSLAVDQSLPIVANIAFVL